MTTAEIKSIILLAGEIRTSPRFLVTPQGKSDLENYFSCTFCDNFWMYMEVMQEINLPAEILFATDNADHDNPKIIDVHKNETLQTIHTEWQTHMMPFLALSSGDYVCIDTRDCKLCPVNIYDHGFCEFERISDSFDEWIRLIPDFFAGW